MATCICDLHFVCVFLYFVDYFVYVLSPLTPSEIMFHLKMSGWPTGNPWASSPFQAYLWHAIDVPDLSLLLLSVMLSIFPLLVFNPLLIIILSFSYPPLYLFSFVQLCIFTHMHCIGYALLKVIMKILFVSLKSYHFIDKNEQ